MKICDFTLVKENSQELTHLVTRPVPPLTYIKLFILFF